MFDREYSLRYLPLFEEDVVAVEDTVEEEVSGDAGVSVAVVEPERAEADGVADDVSAQESAFHAVEFDASGFVGVFHALPACGDDEVVFDEDVFCGDACDSADAGVFDGAASDDVVGVGRFVRI